MSLHDVFKSRMRNVKGGYLKRLTIFSFAKAKKKIVIKAKNVG